MKKNSSATVSMQNRSGGSIPSDAVWSSDFDRAQLMNTVEYDAYNEGVYTDWWMKSHVPVLAKV